MAMLDPLKVKPGNIGKDYVNEKGKVLQIVPLKDWKTIKDQSTSGWMTQDAIDEHIELDYEYLVVVEGPDLGYYGGPGTEVYAYGYDGFYIEEDDVDCNQVYPIAMKPLIDLVNDEKPVEEYGFNKVDEHLQKWRSINFIANSLVYKAAADHQMNFIRDKSQILFNLLKISVISTHTSKSILLPVYKLIIKEKVTIILRDNFHGCIASVLSETPIDIELIRALDKRDEKLHKCYCEGFDESWIFNPYKKGCTEFTISIYNESELYILFFLLKEFLNNIYGEKN